MNRYKVSQFTFHREQRMLAANAADLGLTNDQIPDSFELEGATGVVIKMNRFDQTERLDNSGINHQYVSDVNDPNLQNLTAFICDFN